MRRFLKDKSGNAAIGAAFMILVFCTLAFVIYSGITVSNKYQTAETELQRAATVAVDTCMINPNVRDLELDIPAASAESVLQDNLIQSGWTLENENWVKWNGDKIIYSLKDVQISFNGQTMQVETMFVMPLSWAMGEITQVKIPMQIRESVLYIK